MALFGGGQTDQQQRYYPRPITEVYQAVVRAAQSGDGLTFGGGDDLSMTVKIKTSMSMFTWGETLTVACLPAEGGTTINVSVAGKVGGQIMQSAQNTKITAKLFDQITQELRNVK